MVECEPSPPNLDTSPASAQVTTDEKLTGRAAALERVLEQVRAITGCDFRPYKTSMIHRRIERRLSLTRASDLAAYARLLQSRPNEAQNLLQDLLISVTAFFREPETFHLLQTQVIPQILQRHAQREGPIRIWVPGCATGEDAYTLAMLFHEALGEQAGAAFPGAALQIFATDIDRRALTFARAGRYPREIAADIDAARLARFFHKQPDHTYRVGKALRESIVFAPQNLLTDPPFLRLDVICCRNVMIYLKPDIQTRLLALFHLALTDEGHLVLGHSESVGRQRDLFAPLADERRVYRKLPAARRQPNPFPVISGGERAAESLVSLLPQSDQAGRAGQTELGKTIRRVVMQDYAPACAAINPRFDILHLYGPTRQYLHLPEGEPTLNLLAMIGEPARHRLRAAVHDVVQSGRPVVSAATAHGPAVLRITVRPLSLDAVTDEPVLLVVFQEAFASASASAGARGDAHADGNGHAEPTTDAAVDGHADASRPPRPPAQIEHELRVVREDLQATIDQFESSNEQLRSSNEQIMSMNEELQSANEELETSQEELQSLNEELRSLNTQLQEKIDQLEQANNDISNFLASTDIATVFLDTDLCIKRFTPSAGRLLGLEASDRGRPINRAMMRLSDESLLGEAAAVLDRLAPVEKEIRTATGAWYTMRVLPYRTAQNRIEGVVLTFTDVTRLRDLVVQSQRRVAQQAIVAELGQRALEGADLQSLMDEAARAVARTLNVEFVKLLELLPSRQELLLRAGVGWPAGTVGQARVGAGLDSQAGYTLAVNSPVVVDDLRKEGRFSGPSLLRDAKVISGLSVIIQGSRRPFGVLGVHSAKPRRFGQEDVNFLQSVAHVIAQAVTRKTFEGELKNLNRQLEKNVEQRTAWLRLMQGTTAAANEATEVAPAVRDILEQVCRLSGWTMGLAFLPGAPEADDLVLLDCVTLNQVDDTAALAEAVRRQAVRRGAGLVGRVYRSGRPTWCTQDADEPLMGVLRRQGQAVRTAIALPVWAGNQAVGVLEFFTDKPVQPDDRLMEVMAQIGTQLGRVIERERSARELRESEHFLSSVADTAPLLFVVVDVVRSRLVYANSQIKSMLGYSAEQLHAMDREELPNIVHVEDRPAFVRLIEQLRESPPGTIIDGEYRLRHSNGAWHTFHARILSFTHTDDGVPQQVLATLEDITERRRAEEALGESQQRFRAVFESAGLGIGLVDPAGKVVAANLALQQMLSYNETELRQITLDQLVYPDDRTSAHDRCMRVLTGDRDRHEMQKRLLRKDGEAIWALCNVSLVRGRGGAPLYAIAIVQDITERKDLDRALADQALREQQRIGQDLHDNLGQELTGLGYMAQTLRNQLREAGRPEAESVHDLAEGLRRALEDVRTVARGLYPVELDTADLQDALAELARTTEAQYGMPCRLHAEAEVPAIERHAANHLFHIVQEAVRNAVKHAEPKEISVRLRRNEQDHFEVLVVDDGRGIPADHGKMEGIGLRIMRHRASVIGADIAVEPGADGGTCIRCTFHEK